MLMDDSFLGINLKPNEQHQPIDKLRNYKSYQLYVVKGKVSKPIPFGDITWEDSVSTLGMKLTFSFPRNPRDHMMKNYDILKLGDKLIFKNKGVEIFRGMITSITTNKNSKDIIAHDLGFLLNKHKFIKQFSKVNSTKAIKDLCKYEGVKVGSIEYLPATITEIYKNESMASIIQNIFDKNYQQTGKRYYMELVKGKLNVARYGKHIIKMTTKPNANSPQFNPAGFVMDISKQESLDNMINRVLVVTDDGKKTQRYYTAKNQASINRYGQMQTVLTVNKDDKKYAKQMAKNHITESSNPKQNITVTLFGDDRVRSGRAIQIKEKTFGVSGKFVILNCKQSYKNGVRLMTLDLEEVK